MVGVELFKVDVFGGSPEFVASDYREIIAGSWPPTRQTFDLGNIPEIEMTNDRFLVVISTSGNCTDVIWDCTFWDGWILFPQDDPFNPVERTDWGIIKALYR